jgi:hypothetical protein
MKDGRRTGEDAVAHDREKNVPGVSPTQFSLEFPYFSNAESQNVDIDEPLKELGRVEVGPLRDAILALDEESWNENVQRQQEYEVHKSTQSVVMVFTDGSGWPDIEITKEAGWDKLVDTAVPLMHRIIADHYAPGGTIIRAMAAKLLAGSVIRPHTDRHPSFHYGHRIHVPITTNSRVRFMIDGRPYRLEVGNAYELNNQKNHSVMNKGSEDRITFIFDYVSADRIDRANSRTKPIRDIR